MNTAPEGHRPMWQILHSKQMHVHMIHVPNNKQLTVNIKLITLNVYIYYQEQTQ